MDTQLVGIPWNHVSSQFESLARELITWRLDRKVPKSGWGAVHSFVRGLRFSARTIYVLRRLREAAGSDLEASWGQLLHESRELCSPECDVIVHARGGYRWNGDADEPVMDFRFVESERARAVISCKARLLDSLPEEDLHYCAEVRKYVDRVHLFVECCPSRERADGLREQARACGFSDLWFLYIWDGKGEEVQFAQPVWREFAETMLGMFCAG